MKTWELGSRETLALLIETGLDYIFSSWKPVVSLWHPYRCTACAACHMMWLASWLSVTSVRTGSMEGKPVFVQENVNCGCSILAGSWKICTAFDWYMFCSCVGVEEDKATEIDLYHCPNCEVTHGPSVSESTFFMFPCHAVIGLCLFWSALIIFTVFSLTSAQTPWRQQAARLWSLWNESSNSTCENWKFAVCQGATEPYFPKVSFNQSMSPQANAV